MHSIMKASLAALIATSTAAFAGDLVINGRDRFAEIFGNLLARESEHMEPVHLPLFGCQSGPTHHASDCVRDRITHRSSLSKANEDRVYAGNEEWGKQVEELFDLLDMTVIGPKNHEDRAKSIADFVKARIGYKSVRIGVKSAA